MKLQMNKFNIAIIVFCVVMMIFAFFIGQNKKKLKEAKRLPFSNTSLELVEDGTYTAKTYTSFMHLELSVTVDNHKLTKIEVLENLGSKGQKAEEIIDRMISQNKVVVDLVEKDELGSLVFISCVDTAIKKGVPENGETTISE